MTGNVGEHNTVPKAVNFSLKISQNITPKSKRNFWVIPLTNQQKNNPTPAIKLLVAGNYM